MRPEVRALFICVDCKFDTFHSEYYMVKHEIWKEAKMPRWGGGMLCIGCLESRLGRRLSRNDFMQELPINKDYSRMSKRLRNRLGV